MKALQKQKHGTDGYLDDVEVIRMKSITSEVEVTDLA